MSFDTGTFQEQQWRYKTRGIERSTQATLKVRIPTRALDQLIAGCGKRTATLLQVLKVTGARIGEAAKLQWTDVDSKNLTISINNPEKGSRPRMWKVTPELICMLKMLPETSTKVFGDSPINSMKSTFIKTRKRLAAKLQNPRLLNTSFHTFRHWKATMLYHKTKDPHYVKDFL